MLCRSGLQPTIPTFPAVSRPGSRFLYIIGLGNGKSRPHERRLGREPSHTQVLAKGIRFSRKQLRAVNRRAPSRAKSPEFDTGVGRAAYRLMLSGRPGNGFALRRIYIADLQRKAPPLGGALYSLTRRPGARLTGAANQRDPHRPSRAMTARFRQDNTEGYSNANLAALNAAFEEVMNANADSWVNDTSPGRDLAFKIMAGQRGRGAPVQVRPRPARRRAANDPIAGV